MYDIILKILYRCK